ncbi:hypothetical protein AA313_de0207682 [Arthrobotrys entomopaga]|nr:hypothetical protein AA313_de0207682 [Arthrobotrys entomopaga]
MGDTQSSYRLGYNLYTIRNPQQRWSNKLDATVTPSDTFCNCLPPPEYFCYGSIPKYQHAINRPLEPILHDSSNSTLAQPIPKQFFLSTNHG